MSKPPPYFPFYPTDFASSGKVEVMTTEEIGAYILLLGKAWHESPPCSIPNDDRILARWTRLGDERWSLARAAVLACFDRRADGRLYQSRLDREWRAMVEYRNRQSENGKKGGRESAKRRCSGASSDGEASVNLPSSSSPPSSKPPPPPQSPVSVGEPPEGGGGGGEVVRMNPDQHAVYMALLTKPVWFVADAPWIDPVTCKDLALLPTTSMALVEYWMAQARSKRKGLKDAAGFVIARLKRPDMALAANMKTQSLTVSQIRERATQNGATA